MTNEPTTGEIVSALRNCPNCDDCLRKDQKCYRNDHDAADRLESQERTIAEKDAEIEKLKSDRCMILGAVTETNVCVGNLIERLTARAESAERERDAAIADMKLIVDAVREEYCDETCCFACKFDCDTSINDSGEYGSECPGFDRDDCFEWRGAREGEGK